MPTRQENCIYHWGRKFTIRGEGRYSCCQQDGSASGCCDAKSHVWDHVDYENLRGYVKTLPKGKNKHFFIVELYFFENQFKMETI